MKKTVSVIIPVYNVEQYLHESLNSVLRQTYEQLEIIIINDGSTDQSGKMCNDFSQSDARIILINQENQGLSAARNHGLEIASGEYIFFLDSDDWIETKTIETMVDALENAGADIVWSGINYVYAKETKTVAYRENCVVDKDTALKLICEDKNIKNFAWGKLYKKSCWEDIRFPVGKYFEDIPTVYKTLEHSQKIAIINHCFYNYRIRDNSISQTINLKHAIDRCDAHIARYIDLKYKKPQLKEILIKQLLYSVVVYARNYRRCSREKRNEFQMAMNETFSFFAENQGELTQDGKLNGLEKMISREIVKRQGNWARKILILNGLNKIGTVVKSKTKGL